MKKNFTFNISPVFLLLLLLLAGCIAYIPLIFNDFVKWDDEIYIVNNPLIQSFNRMQLEQIFTTSFEGHYHPFTLLSLSIDYHLFGLEPLAFHLHNFFLHLMNTVLVFVIIRKLSGNLLVAWLTASFFLLHPMHVEAVAWATARKDVLYSLYFLTSILTYLLYQEKQKSSWYFLSLLLFIFSMFSKGQAVFLPLCLVIFCYLKGERLKSWSLWKDKLPYLILALISGIISILAQQSTGYMGETIIQNDIGKMLLTANLGLWTYLFKLLVPFPLSAYYPVPDMLGTNYYIAGLGSVLLTIMLIFFLFRYSKGRRILNSGWMFFLVNIFIFLRWIPVSNYLIADRYTYLSSVGLFFLAAYGISWIRQHSEVKFLWVMISLGCVLCYGVLTFQRISIWRDSYTLVDDILRQHPDVYPALNTRGVVLMERGDFRGAQADFDRAIALQPHHSRGWANRGSLLFQTGRHSEGLQDLNKAVSLDPANARLLNNRGLMFDALGQAADALKDFNSALKYDPFFAEAYSNRGMVLAKTYQPEKALIDFNKAVEINPSLVKAFANRGMTKNKLADFQGASEDLEHAVSMGFSNAPVYFELGFSWYNLRNFFTAKKFFDKALSLEPEYVDALKYKGFSLFNEKDFVSAAESLSKAIALDSADALMYGMRGLALARLNRIEEACRDFALAEAMGLTQVKKERERYCK